MSENLEPDGNLTPQTELSGDTLSPLKMMMIESHEVFLELKIAGFPERVATQIVAQMIADAVLYRDDPTFVDMTDEDDDDEDDDDEDDQNERYS